MKIKKEGGKKKLNIKETTKRKQKEDPKPKWTHCQEFLRPIIR